MGLLAAGTWSNFSDVNEAVMVEAASLAALYRDVSSLPLPYRGHERVNDLRYFSTALNSKPFKQSPYSVFNLRQRLFGCCVVNIMHMPILDALAPVRKFPGH